MEKLDPKTEGAMPDIVEQNIEKMKELFPDIFKEGKVDLDALRETLGDYVDEREERYSFTWNGKAHARRIAHANPTGTLRPCPEESVNWDTTQNLFIEGDNLEVLKLLRKSYHKKVKMIYIDPPYNTGGEFIYPDRYQDNLQTYLRYTGQVDKEGLKLSTNTETSGRYHTNWLNMMYPRLNLARNLLRDDGVIFVSIDDHEAANLKLLMDEVFGVENFVASIVIQVNRGGRDYLPIAVTHEYLLCYRRSEQTILEELPKPGELPSRDERGGYELRELRNRNPKFNRKNRPNLYYPVFVDSESRNDVGECAVSLEKSERYNIAAYPRNSKGEDGCWRWGKPRTQNKISSSAAHSDVVGRQRRDGGWNVYEKNRRVTSKAKSIWDQAEVRTERGTIDLRELDLHHVFDHPKPVALLKKILTIGSRGDDLILDFFAGSGTLAQAVAELNREDGGRRRHIVVQLPEPTQNIAYTTIADVAKARLRAVAFREASGPSDFQDSHGSSTADTGFRVFKLDSTNIKLWDADLDNLETALLGSIENIKADRSEMDVLYELLLKYGLDLAVPIEERKIVGKTVYIIGSGALVVCLAKKISLKVVEGIAALREELESEAMRVVFKDSGFADDVVKTNAVQILRQAGIEDVKSL